MIETPFQIIYSNKVEVLVIISVTLTITENTIDTIYSMQIALHVAILSLNVPSAPLHCSCRLTFVMQYIVQYVPRHITTVLNMHTNCEPRTPESRMM